MSALIQHLNKHFSAPDLQKMSEHFQETFGVCVKQEGDLYLFKYNAWAADFDNPVTLECRGHILRHSINKGWWFVCRPFDKFFNLHEGQCPIRENGPLGEMYHKLEAVEKVDGTLISVWWDEERDGDDNGGWRCSTLGGITPMPVSGHPTNRTFGEAFVDLFRALCGLQPRAHGAFKLLPTYPGRERTYLFELVDPDVHKYTDAVTKYPGARLTLLGIRSNITGEFIEPEKDMNHLMIFRKIRTPYTYNLHTAFNGSHKMTQYLHSVALQESNLGENPEGFVLVDKETHQPIAKVKMAEWIQAHELTKGNNWAEAIVRGVFRGGADDVLTIVPENKRSRAEEFLEWVEDMVDVVIAKARSLREVNPVHIANGRQYANAVRDLQLGDFQDLFF